MENSKTCKCGHLMAYHGCINNKGYCPVGNDGDCKCHVKGDTYEEAISKL
jgi:hypothetical protein